MHTRLILLTLFLFLFTGGCATQDYRASKIRVQHPNWDSTTVRKVSNRLVESGMTPDMVRAAIGLPDAISRTDGTEIWQYQVFVGDYQPKKETVYTVYFQNGAVTRTTGNRERLKTLTW